MSDCLTIAGAAIIAVVFVFFLTVLKKKLLKIVGQSKEKNAP